ncbi:MAG: dienelactone hydrolase family protein [Bacteroidales bacterium]|nr:dienelactone hydrolase family protein [Bacteroidales bacterium]
MKAIKSSFFILVTLTGISTYGQMPEELPLYRDGLKNNPILHVQDESYADSLVKPGSLSNKNRVYSYISNPTYLLFPAADSNNKHIGLVIFPGGGLVNNWLDKEGTDLALWLAAKGINCMVVKYRTNQKDINGKYLIPMDVYKEAVVLDAGTSVLRMRELSDSLKLDKDKVGVLGFSAGGWLTEKLVFKSCEGHNGWQPSFAGLIYHGNSVKEIEKIKDKKCLPPFFMAVAKDDKKIPLHRILPYLTAIVAEVEKSELHIYSKGDHGFGLAYNNGYSVELWKESFYRWVLDIYNK